MSAYFSRSFRHRRPIVETWTATVPLPAFGLRRFHRHHPQSRYPAGTRAVRPFYQNDQQQHSRPPNRPEERRTVQFVLPGNWSVGVARRGNHAGASTAEEWAPWHQIQPSKGWCGGCCPPRHIPRPPDPASGPYPPCSNSWRRRPRLLVAAAPNLVRTRGP